MGKHIHREVVNGRMTVTQARRMQGKAYTLYVEQFGPFGQELPPKEITKHRPGRMIVETLVYPGPEEKGDPIAEWEFPYEMRFDFHEAARIGEAQTDR
jgi:hypothetical protein